MWIFLFCKFSNNCGEKTAEEIKHFNGGHLIDYRQSNVAEKYSINTIRATRNLS